MASIGPDPAKFGTHSLRRTKAVVIFRQTGNLRAGHSKIESIVRYLGIEVDDAIEIAQKIDIRQAGRARRLRLAGTMSLVDINCRKHGRSPFKSGHGMRIVGGGRRSLRRSLLLYSRVE